MFGERCRARHPIGPVACLCRTTRWKGTGCRRVGRTCFPVCCCMLQRRNGAWERLQVAAWRGKARARSRVTVWVGQGWAARANAVRFAARRGEGRALALVVAPQRRFLCTASPRPYFARQRACSGCACPVLRREAAQRGRRARCPPRYSPAPRGP